MSNVFNDFDDDLQPGASATGRWRALLLALLLMAITAAAYAPVYRAGWVWDDDDYITQNPNLRSFEGLLDTWTKPESLPQYYPLVHTTFWIEHHLWGDHPLGYHVVNVLLHSLGAVLLWRLLKRLEVPGAWLAGAIFALHPIHVESVAWVTERKNTLSCVFYLLSAICLARFFYLPKPSAYEDEVDRRWYVPALAAFVLALCSKTVTSTLPAAVLVVLWWKRGKVRWQDAGLLSPFFILGAGMGQITASMEKYHVGAIGMAWDLSLAERCLIAGRALLFYAGKLLWPMDLMFIYPRWTVDVSSWQQWALPAVVLAGLLGLILLSRWIGRGPAAAAMLFCGTLFPALGFFNIYPMQFSFVADHFAYLATLGPIALIAAAAAMLASRWKPAVSIALAAVLLAALGARTFDQARWYRDAQTLWTRTLQQNPGALIGYYNLASMAAQRGDFEDALVQTGKAIEQAPEQPMTHANHAAVLAQAGRFDEAIAAYHQAISLFPGPEPKLGMVQFDLAGLLAKRKDWEEVVRLLRQSLESRAWHLATRRMLVQALVESNQLRDAMTEAQSVVDKAGPAAESTDHFNLGLVLHRRGKSADAEQAYRRALDLEPDHVGTLVNLGALLAQSGKRKEALPLLEQALTLDPTHAAAWQNLGLVLEGVNRRPDAIAALREALRLDGSLIVAKRRLAWLLAIDPAATPEQASEALTLAKQLPGQDPLNLDALAAAHAAAGDFTNALATIDQAIAAVPVRDKRLIETLQQRRGLYAQGEPFKLPKNKPKTKRVEPAK